ncbi:MAG: AraC family transcriptional regulator [Chromatiales bacterium]|nr:AraC family transcriptional regulator [Chromatiales bacterium]
MFSQQTERQTVIEEDALTQLLTHIYFDTRLSGYRHYSRRWTVHISNEEGVPFHLIVKGRAWIHTEGNKPILLRSGDLILLPKQTRYVIASDSTPVDTDHINQTPSTGRENCATSMLCGTFIFDSDAAKPLLDTLPDIVLLLNKRGRQSTPGIHHLIDATLDELAQDSPGRGATLCSLARLLFFHILRDRFTHFPLTGYFAALSHPQIGHVLSLIHTRYGEELSLERLAREAGMCRTSLINKFNQYVGMPPAKYLTAWRMQTATALLKNTDLSIEQVAVQCGYQSAVSFRKAYKVSTGFTPKQIRLDGSRRPHRRSGHSLHTDYRHIQ